MEPTINTTNNMCKSHNYYLKSGIYNNGVNGSYRKISYFLRQPEHIPNKIIIDHFKRLLGNHKILNSYEKSKRRSNTRNLTKK